MKGDGQKVPLNHHRSDAANFTAAAYNWLHSVVRHLRQIGMGERVVGWWPSSSIFVCASRRAPLLTDDVLDLTRFVMGHLHQSRM